MTQVNDLIEALIWCSGSADFGPGGQAREGWLKICQPLIDAGEGSREAMTQDIKPAAPSDPRLDEWEKLANAATPGPWRDGQEGNIRVYGPDGMGEHSGLLAVVHKGRANAAFIAAAREAIPALIGMVRTLKRQVNNAEAHARREQFFATNLIAGPNAAEARALATEARVRELLPADSSKDEPGQAFYNAWREAGCEPQLGKLSPWSQLTPQQKAQYAMAEEEFEVVHGVYRRRINELLEANNRYQQEAREARARDDERVHYAEGTAKLAMQHRDEAEARAKAAEARAKELEAELSKPTAWTYELAHAIDANGEYTRWGRYVEFIKPNVPPKSIRGLTPLYDLGEKGDAGAKGS